MQVVRQCGTHRPLKIFIIQLVMGWIEHKVLSRTPLPAWPWLPFTHAAVVSCRIFVTPHARPLTVPAARAVQHAVVLDPKYKLPRMRYKGDGVRPHTMRAETRTPLVTEVRGPGCSCQRSSDTRIWRGCRVNWLDASKCMRFTQVKDVQDAPHVLRASKTATGAKIATEAVGPTSKAAKPSTQPAAPQKGCILCSADSHNTSLCRKNAASQAFGIGTLIQQTTGRST